MESEDRRRWSAGATKSERWTRLLECNVKGGLEKDRRRWREVNDGRDFWNDGKGGTEKIRKDGVKAQLNRLIRPNATIFQDDRLN